MHYIRYDVLYQAVLERLQFWARAVQQDEEKVLKKIQKAGNAQRLQTKKKAETALKKAESLSEEIRKMEQEMIGAEKWVELIKENAVPKELTTTLLNTMIEKILIHAPEIDDNGERTQEIEIYYRFIGKID